MNGSAVRAASSIGTLHTALRLAPLFAAFFLSGASALVYQTAWQRMLGIFGGSDNITAALVVGAFLLGLGLGSLWASLFADRCDPRRAIFLFALCEAGIGICGAASPLYFDDVLLGALAPWANDRVLVFAAAFTGMLAPTLFMGLSLPLLARAVVDRIETSAVRIGGLYAVNTVGAGAGAFLAGLYAIGTFGFETSILAAAVVNLAVAAIAALVGLRIAPAPPRAGGAAATGGLGAVPRRVWAWGALVFVSGFIIIALEIVWFRVVGVILQGNVYTFSIVLGVFLVADALGIWLGIHIVRRVVDPRALFIGLQTAVGLYALVSIGGLFLVYDVWPIARELVTLGMAPVTERKIVLVFVLVVALVTPPALLLGMSFPIVQRAVQEDPDLVGQRVGLIQLCNILGNAAGSLVAGLVLLHVLGTAGTLRVIAALAFLVTLLLLVEGTARRMAAGLAAAALALLVSVFPGNAAFWERIHSVPAGVSGIVAEDRSGLAVVRVAPDTAHLFVFGHFQSRVPFESYHLLLGAIGPLVHPDPKSVLVIGSGLGATPYGAGLNPATTKVRVVEIVEPVYAVRDAFARLKRDRGIADLVDDRRYTHVVGDGRHDLAIATERYDVIEADAILPKTANSGLLYSAEFFAMVRDRLKPGGIAVQWAPTSRTIATFASVFPYVLHLRPLDILLGSNAPIPFDAARLRARLEEPAIKAKIEAARVVPADMARWAETVVGRWEPSSLRPFPDVNTDLFPKDEYYLNNIGTGLAIGTHR